MQEAGVATCTISGQHDRTRRAKRHPFGNAAKAFWSVRQSFSRDSNHFANQAATVVVEKLNTPGMTRSARGTAEKPGKQVKAKAGLDRGILAPGWHRLRQRLAYKGRVVEINPACTPQTCHSCADAHQASCQGRMFSCVACGHADLNAARTIMAAGTGASARREAFALATSVTRETGTVTT